MAKNSITNILNDSKKRNLSFVNVTDSASFLRSSCSESQYIEPIEERLPSSPSVRRKPDKKPYQPMLKFLTKIPDKIIRKSHLPPKPQRNFDLKLLHLIPEDSASGIPTRKASIMTLHQSRSSTPTPPPRVHQKPPIH